MPWNPEIYSAVCAGLRDSAKNGELVPHVWSKDVIRSETGGHVFYGCGWGVVGWVTAVMMGGKDWAARAVPIGCSQGAINQVLLQSGLTVSEISDMDPVSTWLYFDRVLTDAYHNRQQDWETYIKVSVNLAEYFIMIISRVPSEQTSATQYLPYNVLILPPREPELPLFAYGDSILQNA